MEMNIKTIFRSTCLSIFSRKQTQIRCFAASVKTFIQNETNTLLSTYDMLIRLELRVDLTSELLCLGGMSLCMYIYDLKKKLFWIESEVQESFFGETMPIPFEDY